MQGTRLAGALLIARALLAATNSNAATQAAIPDAVVGMPEPTGAAAMPAQKLPPIVVKAAPKRSGTSGIVARTSSAATRTDTPLIDVPISVSTVTRAQMTALDDQDINQVLSYSSGVATSQRGEDAARYDQLTIRGFTSNTGSTDQFLDGLPLLGGAYYAAEQVDPFLLEGVDVLKGPPSVVYGNASPGGVIVESSKLPTAQTIDAFDLEGGTYATVRGTIDLAGKVIDDGSLLYRFTGTGLTADGQQYGTDIRHYAFAPALTWIPDDETIVMLLGRYQRDPSAGAYSSAPSVGTALYNPLGTLKNDFYNGDPSDEIFNRSQSSINPILDRLIVPGWKLHVSGRYTGVGSDTEGVYSGDLEPGSYSELPRYTYGSKENVDALAFIAELVGHARTGAIRHELLLGVGDRETRDDYNYGGGDAPALDIFDPDYSLPVAHPGITLDTGQTVIDTGIYAQDQMTLGHVHVILGGREDWSEIDTRDILADTNVDQSDRAFTFRGGILYAFDNGISPYFNYAQSFQPNIGTDAAGAGFVPTRGEQYEVGTKYQPRGFTSFMSAALYDLTETNVLVTDPASPLFEIASGAIRSRGIELEAHATLADGLDLIGSYTYQGVVYVEGGASVVGRRAGQVPAQFASVWLHYTRKEGRLRGAGIGLGVRYTGDSNVLDTYGSAAEFTTPSYTLIDMRAEYALQNAFPKLKHMVLAVNATNLGNARYITSCYSGLGCFLGANRTVIGQLSYNW